MPLEGLIGSEEEEQFFQKGQKKERFMAGLGAFLGTPIWFTVRDKDMQGKLNNTWFCVPYINRDSYKQAGRIDVIYDKNPQAVVNEIQKLANYYATSSPKSPVEWVSDPSMLSTALTKQLYNITTWAPETITKIGAGAAYPGPGVTVTPPAKPPVKPTKTNGGKVGTMPPSQPSKSGCFIATAAFGTPLAPEIDSLRNFRDECLAPSLFGRAFIKFYYTVSPPIAAVVARVELFRKAVRAVITPLVRKG